MDRLADTLERACAHPAALPVFLTLAGLGWDLGVVDVANYLISVFTVGLLLLSLGRDRRERMATQAKLDALVAAIPDADDGHVRLEERTEAEIEARRK